MANDKLGIIAEINFETYDKVNSKLEALLKKLQKANKLDIEVNTETFQKLEKQFNQLKNKIEGSLKTNLDATSANKSIDGLVSNMNNLQKKQVKIIDNETVQLIEQSKRGLLESQRIITNIKSGSKTVINTEDYSKAQTDLYKQLNNLQNQEFAIKQKMIGQNESIRAQLEQQLGLVQQQKLEVGKALVQNNLVDDTKNNALLIERQNLKSNLIITQEKYNAKMKTETEEVQKQIKNFKELMNIKLQNLQSKYGSLVDGKEVENFKKSLDGLNTNNFNKGAISNEFSKIESNVKASASALKLATKDAQSFGDVLKNDITKFAMWMVSGTVIMQGFKFFRDGVFYITDLNKSLTQISIVTGKTQEEVRQLGFEYANLAKQMSVSTKEIASAATEFYRQGLDQGAVMDRLRTTTQYAKISNLDFRQSAEILTATVNSMGVSVEKAADVFAYLGDATATGADEVGIAMSKVAGSASVAQIPLEKIASWIAEVSSKTRESAESIGFSFQSILSRYAAITETGFNEEDATSINDVTKALTAVGIQATDSQGQLRNFGDVLDSLGSKWQSLDKKSQAYIGTTLAGTRQQSRLFNLLNSYSDSVQLYNDALQSANTTQEKYNLWLEGTEAHLNKLRLAGTDIWQTVFNSNDIRIGIDLLTGLTNGVGSFIKTFGGLPTLVGGVVFAMTMLNKSFEIGTITRYIGAVMSLPMAYREAKAEGLGLSAALNAVGIGFDVAKIKAIAFQTAVSLGLSLVVTGLISGLSKLYNTFIDTSKIIEDHKQKIADLTTKYNDLKSEIDALREIKNPNEEQKEYLSLLERELQLKEEIIKQEKRALVDKEVFGKGVLGKGLSADIQEELQDVQDIFAAMESTKNEIADRQMKGLSSDAELEHLQNLKDQLKEIELSFIESRKTLEEYSKVAQGESKKGIANLLHSINMMLPQLQSENNLVKSNTDELKKNTDAKIANANATDTQDSAEKKYQEEFTKSMDAIGEYRAMLKELQNDKGKYDSTKNLSTGTYKKIIEDHKELIPYLNNEQQLYEQLNNLVQKHEGVATTAYQNMMASSEEYYRLHVQGKGIIENMLQELQNKYQTYFNNLTEGQKADLENAKTIAQKRAILESGLIENLARAWGKYYRTLSGASTDIHMLAPGLGDDDGYSVIRGMNEEAYKRIQELLNLQADISSGFDDIIANISTPDFDDIGGSNSSKELEKAQNEAYQVLEEISSRIIDMYRKQAEEEKKILDDKLSDYESYVNEKLRLIQEEEDAEDYNKNLTKAQQQKQSIQDMINQLSLDSSREAKAKIEELKKQLAEQEENISDMIEDKAREDRKDNLQQELEDYRKLIEQQKADIDELYSDSNLEQMAKAAILSGTFQGIGGEIISLNEALIEFLSKSGESLGVLGEKLQNELLDKLAKALELIQVINSNGTIDPNVAKDIMGTSQYSVDYTNNSNLGSFGGISISKPSAIIGIDTNKLASFINGLPGSITQFIKPQLPNFSNPALTTPSNVNLNFDSLINVEGNVDKNVMPSLQDLTNRVCEQITNTMRMQGLVRR